MIELTNITKTYQMGTQEVHALKGVNLTINKGEFVAIVGTSGSGKSTLMNIIGCLDIPSNGTYILNNTDVSEMDDDQQAQVRGREIGFVFQRFNLLARTQAVKQVSLPLMYQGVGRRERTERAEAALTSVGLGDRTDHKPDELSGGQQQRVAIARALVTEPSILLADEPTGALDTESGEEVLGIFSDLHKDGMTLIMVTHDLEVAARAERIITLRDGIVIRDEKTAETGQRSESSKNELAELLVAPQLV